MTHSSSSDSLDPNPSRKREAEEAAEQALADGSVTVQRMGAEMHVQRGTPPIDRRANLFSVGLRTRPP